MRQYLSALDKNVLTYWLGLVLLFLGLATGWGIPTALVWVGGIIAAESTITSYIAASINREAK